MLKLAFIVGRNNFFKTYAPVIDAALQRGWSVECWLRQTKNNKDPKAYLMPTFDNIPHFQNGTVEIRHYENNYDCLRLITESVVDAVISVNPKQKFFSEATATPNYLFVNLQQGFDTFGIATLEHLASSDLLCFYSPFWAEWGASYYSAHGYCSGRDFKQMFQDKIVYTGYPGIDILSQFDRSKIREQWHIPSDQPVVLLLPIPLATSRGAWAKFFAAETKLTQTFYLLMGSLVEDWNLFRQYQDWVANGWNDARLNQAISDFCKANGAYLIAKGRFKDPVRSSLETVADKLVYDDSYYPATVFEAIAISDLCIHFYSSAVFEAIQAGIHTLSLHRPCARTKNRAESNIAHQLARTNWPGNFYNYEGVNTWLTIPQAITDLPHKSLNDFSIDPQARLDYIQKYLGYSDGNSSNRVLDAIQQRINASSGP